MGMARVSLVVVDASHIDHMDDATHGAKLKKPTMEEEEEPTGRQLSSVDRPHKNQDLPSSD